MPKSLSTNGMRAASNAPVTTLASGDETRVLMTRGTTSFLEVGPEVVLICRVSGDVDQGREMKILPRELDALDAAVIAIERVGKRGRAGHPEGVGRVFEPLAVQRSEPGRAKALRRLQVSLVSRRGARFGEAFPLRKQPLENLNIRRLQALAQVLARGVLVDEPRVPKGTWKQQPNRPSEEHTEERHMPQKEQPKSIGDRLVTR